MAKSVERKFKSDDAESMESPSQAFARIINIIELTLRIVGINAVRDGKFTLKRNTVITLVSVTSYFVCTISTMVKMYSVNKHYLVEVVSTMGSAVQGCNKLFLGIWLRPMLYDLRRRLEAIYEEYSEHGPRYARAMNRNCATVHRVSILLAVSYTIGVAGLTLAPLPSLIMTGKRNLIIHFHIPGLDVNTDMGYFGTLALQTVCIAIGTFGLYTGDNIVVIFLMQCFTLTDIFRLKIESLNELTEAEYDKPNNNNEKKTTMLINIVKWHQTYTDFMVKCNDVFFWPVSITITSTVFSILVTIYLFLSTDWSGALPYLVSCICILYIYCILGTKIDDCNDTLCYEIYNITWYKLDSKQRRILLTMLAKSQRPNGIDVLGVIPLSVATGLSITKTIYSITMMMIQFLDQ